MSNLIAFQRCGDTIVPTADRRGFRLVNSAGGWPACPAPRPVGETWPAVFGQTYR